MVSYIFKCVQDFLETSVSVDFSVQSNNIFKDRTNRKTHFLARFLFSLTFNSAIYSGLCGWNAISPGGRPQALQFVKL